MRPASQTGPGPLASMLVALAIKLVGLSLIHGALVAAAADSGLRSI
jgi:hypothetical protein